MMIRCFLVSYLAWISAAVANPLTMEMDQAQPDAKELQQAREQLQQPLPQPVAEPLFVPPFHKRMDEPSPPATLCRSCHQQAPHRNDPRKRAFLNMHGRHIACETCHWLPEGKKLDYGWVKVLGSDHPDGMIAPSFEGEPVLIRETDSWARKLKQEWEQADDALKAEIKARLHYPLQAKGPGCGACHDDEASLLDFRALGYKPERARELELDPTARFIERTEPVSADEPVRRIHIRDLLE
ncbi:hypothetical protein [Thiolapillus sp.]